MGIVVPFKDPRCARYELLFEDQLRHLQEREYSREVVERLWRHKEEVLWRSLHQRPLSRTSRAREIPFVPVCRSESTYFQNFFLEGKEKILQVGDVESTPSAPRYVFEVHFADDDIIEGCRPVTYEELRCVYEHFPETFSVLDGRGGIVAAGSRVFSGRKVIGAPMLLYDIDGNIVPSIYYIPPGELKGKRSFRFLWCQKD